MKISKIVEICDYVFCGEDIEVDNIKYSGCADKNSIAIVRNSHEVDATDARCVLSTPGLFLTDKTIIYTNDDLELAAVKIAKVIMESEKKSVSEPIKYATVDNYFLGRNVSIGEGTIILPNVCIDDDVTIGANCVIGPNAHVGRGTIIKNNVKIGTGAYVGAESFYHYFDKYLQEFEGIGNVIVEDFVSVGNHTIIQRGTFSDTIIGKASRIGNQVDIGHDTIIGENTKIVSQVGIASNVTIGRNVLIYGQVGVANHVTIGDYATIYAKSLVTKNVKENQSVSGIYAREHREELRTRAKVLKL